MYAAITEDVFVTTKMGTDAAARTKDIEEKVNQKMD